MKRWRLRLMRTLAFYLFVSTTLMLTSTTSSASAIECKPIESNQQPVIKPTAPNKVRQIYPVSIVFHTNCGDIEVQTDGASTPVTLTVITSLLMESYYKNSVCHRLTNKGIFILQCGDPTGNGTGDIGFRYKDENLPLAEQNNYPRGTIGMANTGPNTNGSQFFISYRDNTISPNYTRWGNIVSGLEIIDFIAREGIQGSGSDGKPNQSLQILGYREVFEPSIQDTIDKQIVLKYSNTLVKMESDLKFAITSRLMAEAEKAKLQSEIVELQKMVRILNDEIVQTKKFKEELVLGFDNANKNLTMLQESTKQVLEINRGLKVKISRICKARPKPKGC